MTVEAPPEEDPALPEEDETEAVPRKRVTIERRVAAAALAFLPAALIVFFGFNGGGYFPGSVGFAGLIVSQMIVVRVLVADDPFAGFSRPLAVVVALFAAFTGFVLASALWSDSEDRALIEFDRALLYLLVLVLMGLLVRRVGRGKWVVRGSAAAAFVVCGSGLISRVLPHVLHTAPGASNNRLSFPLTYWNALGILAAIGMLLAFGLTASDRESRIPRALAAAAVPVFACTLLFTFSRGAMAAALVGLVGYLVFARQRALVGALLAVVPTTLIALVVAYHADELATHHPATARGVAQGKDVALAIGLCMLAALALRLLMGVADRRMERIRLSAKDRRRLRLGFGAGTAVVVVIALAAGGASWIGDQCDGFINGGDLSTNTDLRTR